MSQSNDGRIASAAGRAFKLALCAGVSALTLASLALANPQGGEVAAGQATISTPAANQTQVTQQSDKTVINWNSFNIGVGETTTFVQPNSNSVALNRIFDNNPSVIAGLLKANGKLILINRNGMVFDSGAVVNTAGLVATSADIGNDDFMAGRMNFTSPGSANAQISNVGLITAEEGGVVAFVAPSVKNSGVITAKLGRVALGAGNTFVLDLYGDSLISFPVSAEIAEKLVGPDGQPLKALVDVSGKIEAGSVQLTARAARGLIDNVINVDGEVIASGIKQSAGTVQLTGVIQNDLGVASTRGHYGDAIVVDGGVNGVTVGGLLNASGEQGGTISVSGSKVAVSGALTANGSAGVGGAVSINGSEIALSGAHVDASGATGAGSIAVGYSGDGAARMIGADKIFVSSDSTLRADAIDSGNGGRIALWSNLATDFRGTLSARGGAQLGDGGFLEVSSKDQVGFSGLADASAVNGVAGRLLLDPKNLIISSPGIPVAGLTDPNQLTFGFQSTQTLTIDPTFITASLNTGTAVTLQANNDLSVLSDIIANRSFGDGGTLTLQAGRSVFINAHIVTDSGNLTVVANELLSAGVVNAQRDAGAAVLSMGVGGSIDAGTGNVRLTIASGTGKTNTQSGDMTLRSITANRIVAENLGPSNGNVVIASGTLTGTSTGVGVALASKGGNFVNNAGAGALSAPNGSWVVYAQTPLANVFGGLNGTPYYNTAYNPADPTNFPVDGNRFAYTIAPVLSVKADDITRDYGDFNADLTYTITGFIGGDNPALAIEGTPFLSTIAQNTSPAGTYALAVGLQTLASGYNYTISLVPGVLTVAPAQLFFRAFGATRDYGDDNPALDGEVVGLKLDDTLADVVSGSAVFSTSATNTTNVGFYAINGAGVSVINSNYRPTVLQEGPNATALEITRAQLTYVADQTTREYGDPNVLTGTLAGLKNGETVSSVASGTLTFTSPATPSSPLGTYDILGGGLTITSGNYVTSILQDPGNFDALTVTAARLIYVADAKSKLYGQLNPVFTGTVQGLKNGDTLSDVTDGTVVWTSPSIDGSSAGLYGVFGEGLTVVNGNYFSEVLQAPSNEEAFTINQVQLSYHADKASRIFGFPDPAFGGEVLGLTNGDSLDSVVTGDLVFTSPATAASVAGFYAINGGGLIVTNPSYFLNILQEPSNATAFTIVGIPLTTQQVKQEIAEDKKGAVETAEGSTSSRSNELNISGVGTVSDDLADGKGTTAHLCVLGVPEAAASASCKSNSKGGQ